MAKKRAVKATATGNDSREEILAHVSKRNGLLDKYWQTLKSSDPNNDKLRTAFGLWGTYPYWKELVDSDLRQTADDAVRFKHWNQQYKLNHVHEEATDVLMKRAEAIGIESDTIWQSAKYCRDLLVHKLGKYYPPNREDDRWPGCLGESLYDLPPDIRQAIQDGHAQVLRLSIKGTFAKPRRSTRPCESRDEQFVVWADDGLAAKEIAAKWNASHPTDNVSDDVVKKAIQRKRDI